ncbi:MAG: OsmC family protein [Candidatus Pacebacteria bacterium]|nr:OsmC family protein [Candidatus Paceibacterota bacterium]
MAVSFPGGKKVDATFDGFTVTTDQSQKNGGDGSAPEPLDLLFAALATCSGVIALIFCQTRGIDTEGMRLRLSAEKNDAAKLFDDVRMKLTLPKEFPRKYRKAILRAVDQCSVKKHLQQPVHIETVVV